MSRIRFFDRTTYLWMRDLHLYAGLLLSPFVVLFALTGIFFVHSWDPLEADSASKTRTWTGQVQIEPEGEPLSLAQEACRQLGLEGEIRVAPKGFPGSFSVHTPWIEVRVRLDPETGKAEMTERKLDGVEAMAFLHLTPSPHGSPEIKRNWFSARMWGWTADSVVYLMLFLSAGGIYLWWTLKAVRRTGGVWLALGALSFGGLALWLL